MNTSAYRSIYKPGLFAGQTVIVTGGGSGIGRCIAHELASLGAALALVGRKLEKLESVQAEIASAVPAAKVGLVRGRFKELPVDVQASLDIAFADRSVSFSYDIVGLRLERA